MPIHPATLRFEIEDDDGGYPALYTDYLFQSLRYPNPIDSECTRHKAEKRVDLGDNSTPSAKTAARAEVRGSRAYGQICIETIYYHHSLNLESIVGPRLGKDNVMAATDDTPCTDHDSPATADGDDENQRGEWCLVKGKRHYQPQGEKAFTTLSGTGGGQDREGDGEPGTIDFYYGNPSTQITRGILHIYKDTKLTAPLGSETTAPERADLDMICVLGIPASRFTTHRLLKFLNPFLTSVNYVRIIRDESPHHYMALLKFTDAGVARHFFDSYNGIPYDGDVLLSSSSRDHTPGPHHGLCHLVYVSAIECERASTCPPFPPLGTTELPKCIVCMERMEESVEGILTVLCDHSFHTACLAQWTDPTCPVCRYVQTGASSATTCPGLDNDPDPGDDGGGAQNECLESGCGTRADLWICLVCGNVGCGRYLGGHASSHWQATQHTYAMELETGRVWDYTGDNYVHRLIQAKGDGKIVEYVRGDGTVTMAGATHNGGRKKGHDGKRRRRRRHHHHVTTIAPSLLLPAVPQPANGTEGDGAAVALPNGSAGLCSGCGKNLDHTSAAPPLTCHAGSCCYSSCSGADSQDDGGASTEGADDVDDYDAVPMTSEGEKFDSISLEYSYLMSQQLEAQRAYFKGEMERFENECVAEMGACRDKLDQTTGDLSRVTVRYDACLRDKEKVDKRYSHLSSRFEKALKDLREERNINACLNRNQGELKDKMVALETTFTQALTSKDAEIRDLREQIRDIMFHLNARDQIRSSELSGEIQDGSIQVPSLPDEGSNKKGSRKLKKNK